MSALISLGDFTAPPKPPTGVSVTDAAAERTKFLLKTKGLSDGGLRVFVVGGGCSGWQYGMALAESFEADDVIVEHNGAKVVMDPDSAQMLAGSEVDYIEDIMKSGFTIFNPNAVKSCACGSSFQTSDNSGVARACH